MTKTLEDFAGKIVVGRTPGNSFEAKLIWKTPYEVFSEYRKTADEISDMLIERGTRLPILTYNEAVSLMVKIRDIARCVKFEGDDDANWWVKEYDDWREVDWAQTELKVCEHGHSEPWEVVADELLDLIKQARFNPVFTTIADIQALNKFCIRIWELAYLNEPEEKND